MARRNPRTDAAVRQAIADILADEIADPRLNLVSITEVQVTPDQKYATVWWSPLDAGLVSDAGDGGDDLPSEEQAAAGLASAASRIRAQLGKRLRLRNTPELRFERDPVTQQADRVEELLRGLRASDGDR